MAYRTLSFAKDRVDFQLDVIERHYVVFSEITYEDGNHGEWLFNESLLDYVTNRVVARGGASYSALRCNLYPLEFSLEDWVSDETIEEANRAFVGLVAKDYHDSLIKAAEDAFINEIHEYLSHNAYATVKKLWYRGKTWREYYEEYFPPKVFFPTAEGLTRTKIRSCIKAAMQVHLASLPKLKAAWLKANLPVGMY